MIIQPKLYLVVLSAILIILAFALVLNTASINPTAAKNIFRSPQALAAADGQALFEQKCKACHTIGGGRTVGPDLKGVTSRRDRDWLVTFSVTPDRLIAQGDPTAKQIVQEYGLSMPNMGISREDAEAILAFIDSQSSAKPGATGVPPVSPVPPAAPVPASSLVGSARPGVSREGGELLFTGKTPFAGGGPSCLSCHNVSGAGIMGGGTVGKDLSNAFTRLGEAGLTPILKAVPFPMMKEIYSAKPLNENEIASLVAFLKDADTQPVGSQNPNLLFLASGVAALLVIGAFQLLWRGRLSGVRRPLVKGGSK